jgi:hypothetical protein
MPECEEEHHRILPKETNRIAERLTVANQPTHTHWNRLLSRPAASAFFVWRAAIHS